MPEKAILAIEEALLSSLFTLRGLVELLIKKGIIDRHELETEILSTETDSVGAGDEKKHMYFEKRKAADRRLKRKKSPGLKRRKKQRRK